MATKKSLSKKGYKKGGRKTNGRKTRGRKVRKTYKKNMKGGENQCKNMSSKTPTEGFEFFYVKTLPEYEDKVMLDKFGKPLLINGKPETIGDAKQIKKGTGVPVAKADAGLFKDNTDASKNTKCPLWRYVVNDDYDIDGNLIHDVGVENKYVASCCEE